MLATEGGFSAQPAGGVKGAGTLVQGSSFLIHQPPGALGGTYKHKKGACLPSHLRQGERPDRQALSLHFGVSADTANAPVGQVEKGVVQLFADRPTAPTGQL